MGKIFIAAVMATVLCLGATAQDAARPRVIGFMTDFDLKDDAVGICKAVMDGIAPQAKVIDITHQAEAYNIAMGARILAGTVGYYPPDAVFIVVIDPGVGSTRKAIVAKSGKGQFYVLPDNGLLTLVQDRDGIAEAHEIANPKWMIGSGISSTFHGRDIFSPAAAHVARGENIADAGPALDVTKLVRLNIKNASVDEKGLHGEVIGTDGPFGNLVLNVPAETFLQLGYERGDTIPATFNGKSFSIRLVKTFSDVPVGEALFFIDSRGRLSVGLNQRSFGKTYELGKGATLEIPRKAK